MNSIIEQNKRVIVSIANELKYYYKNLTIKNTILRPFTFTVNGEIVTASIEVNVDINTYPSVTSIVGYSYALKNLPVSVEYINKITTSDYHEIVLQVDEMMNYIINEFKVMIR